MQDEQAFALDAPDESLDDIYSAHELQRYPFAYIPKVIAEWFRVLKPGGRLRVSVPDLQKIVNTAASGNPDRWPIDGYLYGAQKTDDEFNRSAFVEKSLRREMERAGFGDIEHWKSEKSDATALPVSLNLQGFKPTPIVDLPDVAAFIDRDEPTVDPARQYHNFSRKTVPPTLPPTVAIMTGRRLGFLANMFAATDVAHARNLRFEKVEGVYWGQCMTRLMEKHLSDGTEWLLALDFDTVFGVQQFDALASLMLEHPEADAIAPLQMKRDGARLLWTLCDDDGLPLPQNLPLKYFDADLCRARDAHFGCTLIRTSAIRKMDKPWFCELPDPDGRWGEQRTDADLFFWSQFFSAGNKLFIANHVAVGHEQSVVTWPDQYFKPHHQFTADYATQGMPPEARR